MWLGKIIRVMYLGQEVECFLFGLVKGFCLLYCLFNVKRVFANGPIGSIFVGLKAFSRDAVYRMR